MWILDREKLQQKVRASCFDVFWLFLDGWQEFQKCTDVFLGWSIIEVDSQAEKEVE